jgi:hypothetical protein
MSYFEYQIVGDLTPTLEEKTTNLVNAISYGNAPFYIQKYYDEPIPNTEDKKKRTIILTSPVNVRNYLFSNFFTDYSSFDFVAYYKQRIM